MNVYEIRVKVSLDPHWSAWFEGLSISHDADGNTVLRGALVDEAALPPRERTRTACGRLSASWRWNRDPQAGRPINGSSS